MAEIHPAVRCYYRKNSAFSMADIISVIYFGGVLKYDASNPQWKERDKFILSKGHACYALYAALARAGYFPKE